MGSFQSMVVIFYNIFTFIIAFLFTKAAQDLAWRIVVLFGTEPSVPQANNPHMFLELYPWLYDKILCKFVLLMTWRNNNGLVESKKTKSRDSSFYQ